MTVKIPKAALIVLAVALVVGGGVAAYLTLIKSSETCFDESGSELSCENADAMTEAEYAEFQDEEEQARQAKQKAQRAADKCEDQLGDTFAAVQELDSRLNVGLPYDAYSEAVGNIRVEYDQVPFNDLSLDCVSEVGLPIESAMNSYVKAGNAWNNCITDFDCEMDAVDPELQAAWLEASDKLDEADSGLRDLAKP